MKMVKTAIAFSLAASAIACNKVDFTPVQETAPVIATRPDPVCRTENSSQSRPVNIVFLVDQSGSNVNGPYEHPGEATDPQKTLRTRIMADFINQHGGKPNLHWSVITFNENTATPLVKNASNAPAYTSDMGVLNTALNAFFTRADVGKTPYRAALQMAAQMIRADGASSDPNSLTLIAFITDGYPTDYCPGGLAEYQCPGRIMESAIDSDVTAVLNSSSGLVQMGTVYYGAQDAEASARLQRMATRGSGQFVDLNQMGRIDLNDVIQVPQTICE